MEGRTLLSAVLAVPDDFASIQAAVTAATPGDTVSVAPGTYHENVTIDKEMRLLSTGGRNATIIEGIAGAGALGTIVVTNNASGVWIGDAAQGFKIVGFDSASPGIENAALYVQGGHSGLQVKGNEIVAQGDEALLSEFNVPISGFVIDGNIFSGQTFVGSTAGGSGFSTQFTEANVPRQLIVIGNGGGDVATASATDVTFTNNQVTGVAGALNSSSQEQGNGLVTIDAANSTITGNTFNGTTTRFGAALRVRRPGTLISGNTFLSNAMSGGTEHLFVQNNTTSLGDIVGLNTFDRGAYVANGSDLSVSISGGVSRAAAGNTVNVLAGTYVEDVSVSVAGIHVVGAGAGSSIIKGAIGGGSATVKIDASNVEVTGFTITRDGNDITTWNDTGLNLSGIAIQGQAITGSAIHDNIITGNRTGIDINNSNGHTIRNNEINDNRTGLIFRNQTDNLTVTQNEIDDNWTVGVLFLDESSGTNSPVQSALNSTFFNNDISGNWYGQIVDRQSGGFLPAPGTTNLKNFSGNWFGTASPFITTANSTEPGYAAQIPTAFGGTATAPGGQPDIAGSASANFDITPMLATGADVSADFGFQGDFSSLLVTDKLAQTGTIGRIKEGINLVNVGGTVAVSNGTFSGQLNIDKAGVNVIGAGIDSTVIDYTGATTGQGGIYITGNAVELRNLTVTHSSPNASSTPRYGIKSDFANGSNVNPINGLVIDSVKVTNSFRTGLDLNGVTNVTVNNFTAMNNGGAGIFMTDVKGAVLSNITTSGNPWTGISIATLGQFFPIGTSGIVFSGSNSFGESAVANGSGQRNGGLQFEMGNFATPANPKAISFSNQAGDGADVTIQSTDFGYLVSSQSFDNSNIYRRFYQALAQAKDAALGTPDHINAGTRYIQQADDSNDFGPRVTQLYVYDNAVPNKMSIQGAISASVNGDVVNVASGTYGEGVTTAGEVITLAPGTGPAQVTVNGLSLDSDDKLALEVNGLVAGTSYDQMIVNGTVSLGSAFLAATGTRTAADGQVVVLVNNDGTDAVTGTFNGLGEGASIIVNGVSYIITYKYNANTSTAGTGNDIALIDVSGAAAPAQGTAVIKTDPYDPTKKALVVTGKNVNDAIQLKMKDNNNVQVNIDESSFHLVATFSKNAFSRIIVYGLGGNDSVKIDSAVTAPAWLFGGNGNDTLRPGGGDGLLLGEAGDDTLQAGKGRDVFIGGTGKDTITGDGQEDILIAGTTDYDSSFAGLGTIASRWGNRSISYANRISNNPTFGLGGILTSSTVHDDAAIDTLTGGSSTDWFFARTTGTNKDKINGLKSGENLVNI